MDPSTPLTLTNIVNTVIFNLNLQVAFNILFYSTVATAGVLSGIKIVEGVVNITHNILFVKFERRSEDIKELNIKTHDRLVEIACAIDNGVVDKRAREARTRLLYNASRLKKYDRTISTDIDSLLKEVKFNKDNTVKVDNILYTRELIDRIRSKIDKLWFGIS